MRTRRLLLVVSLATLLGASPLARAAEADAQQLFYDGYELLTRGKAEEAAARFEAGLKLEPTNAQAQFYLGHAYEALGQPERARRAYEAAIAADTKGTVAAQARKMLKALQEKEIESEMSYSLCQLHGRLEN